MNTDPPLFVAADRLDVGLMGAFSVALAGTAIPDDRWPSLRSTHLVQLLALADRRRLTREQVIESLWPQLDPEAGAANLRKAAHYARQALGRQDGVVLQGGDVMLAPHLDVHVDAQTFEQRARAALASGDAAACANAAALYGGDLLPAARYEAWTEPARERLRSLQISLLRTACRWEALAELEPTDEPAHRELMARELAAGNRAAAIRWYARLRSALQQVLGVAPDAATQALYRRAVEGLERRGPPLVGRELERAQLDAWIARPLRQRPAGVLVRGPGGIGKSALGLEFAADARAAGWTVVAVTAALPGRPYGALAAVAEQLVPAQLDLLDAVGPAARAALALLTPVAGPAPVLPGPLSRHQVIGAFRRLLLAASKGGDVMLLVDDAHLLDDAEADVVLHLASAGPPVFVWLAGRPPAPASVLARRRAARVSGAAARDRPRAAAGCRSARAHRAGGNRSDGGSSGRPHRCTRRRQPLHCARAGALRRRAVGAPAGQRRRSDHRAAVRRARRRTRPPAAARLGERRVRRPHRGRAGPRRRSAGLRRAGCGAAQRRPRRRRHALPLLSRTRAPGAHRPGAAAPEAEAAPRRRAGAHRARCATGTRGPPLARRRKRARGRALAAGCGAGRAARGRVQRCIAPPRAGTRTSWHPSRGAAHASRSAGRAGRPAGRSGVSCRRRCRGRPACRRSASEGRAGADQAG